MRRAIVTVALAAALATAFPGPAGAVPAKVLRCGVNASITMTPGISTTPASSTFSGTGTAVCQRQPALGVLVGVFSISGTTSPLDDCALGAGSGTLTITVAGMDGVPLTLTAKYTYLRTGMTMNGPVTGTNNDSGYGDLLLSLVPAGPRQNCGEAPLRKVTAAGAVTLTGSIN